MASNISKLPEECLVMIFEYLTLEEQLACLWVSDKWRKLVENFILKRKEEIKLQASYGFQEAEEWEKYMWTPEGFEHVIRLCGENLRSLDLTGASYIDNVQELRLADVLSTYCKQLDTLKLSDCTNTDEFNRLIVSLGSNLKTLELHHGANDQLTLIEISTLFDNCKHLENLSIPYSDALLTSDAFINTPSNLKKIDISGCDLDNKCFENMLANCKDTLEELYVTGCGGFTAGCLSIISQFHNLKVLDPSGCLTSGFGILSNLTKLEVLNVHGEYVSDEDLSAIVNGCKRLRKLNVFGSALTAQGLECLSEAKALEDLNVTNQPGFCDESLQIVAKLPHLTHFRLWGCPSVSCDGVKAMAPLASRLEYLDLSRNEQIDDIKVLEEFHSTLPNRKI